MNTLSTSNEDIINFFKNNKFINFENFILNAINDFKININKKDCNNEINELNINDNNYLIFENSFKKISKEIETINKLMKDNKVDKSLSNNMYQTCNLCGENILCKTKLSLRTHKNIHCSKKNENKDIIEDDTSEIIEDDKKEIIEDNTKEIINNDVKKGKKKLQK